VQLRKAYILTVNNSSSSLKFSLFNLISNEIELTGAARSDQNKDGIIEVMDGEGKQCIFRSSAGYPNDDKDIATKTIIEWLYTGDHQFTIIAVGHRVVQGGPDHREPALLADDLLQQLNRLICLAPNHLPNEINSIGIFRKAFPDIPHVACFDTSFHRDMPDNAKYYPLPAAYRNKGMIRYGFHGLSYEYIMEKLAEHKQILAKKKIIIAHLGNSAGMVAVKNGKSVDTTMGLSPIGGLAMGTRSGDLDPGVLLYLLKQEKLSTGELDELLSMNSGLKAIAGTGDVKELLKNETSSPDACLALTMFCYQVRKYIGALAAAMGGLDMLVFTGGIGENSSVIRQRICEGLEFMGITIDKISNSNGEEIISSDKNWVKVSVIKANEEWVIAKHTQSIIGKKY
jgi:acetate kinase